MLKKLLLALFFVSSAASASANNKVKMDEPYAMVQQVAENTFNRISADQEKIKVDAEHLRAVVEQELLPYIDYNYAAYKVLGSYIQKIRNIEDAQEKKQEIAKLRQFIEVFKNYLVATYAGVFTQYNQQKVEFEPVQNIGDDKIAMIRTKIIESGKPDINIAFKVKKDSQGQWRAFDMVAEGISLLDAKQSELHGILRTEGLDYVIDLLDKKSKLPIQFRGKSGDDPA
ncbi:phospholipid transport system substrate-binding protein [Pseudoalteromonas ulvae UL12]|uniref:MlaC/ttg2D family ABC transporter substrate-binding protein n=1 Tax=Pseudoalteromonas ulvae TaxID=107327 RepID=UPI00186B72BD|nr:ABC transporter substrate-binding protein [Pseudoalteromonas ulvae]MBE0364989.1 phospholipid transport system substrate-binding protein [Pseudoalteromonas ulvae UL12]